MSFFYMWGSFAGPVLAGIVFDRTHSYVILLWILFGMLILATLMVLLLIRPWARRTRLIDEVQPA